MNAYHHKMIDHVYPFLAEDWTEAVAYYSEWLEYEDIVLELVRHTRKNTTPGTSRLVQMTCLYIWAPLARDLAKLPPRELDKAHWRLTREVS